jgi:hypothetical protein
MPNYICGFILLTCVQNWEGLQLVMRLQLCRSDIIITYRHIEVVVTITMYLIVQDCSSVEAMELHLCISTCRKEIHGLRLCRKRILESEYTLIKKILRLLSSVIFVLLMRHNFRLWADLKMVRDNQGYSSTTTSLVITK